MTSVRMSSTRSRWTPARPTLEENAAMLHRLAERAGGRNLTRIAERFLSRAHGAELRARIIRDALQNGEGSAVA